MCETRFERVQRLVSLGELVGSWYPLLVPGRPVFGSEGYRFHNAAKAIIIHRNEYDDQIAAMVFLPNKRKVAASWRALNPKLIAMIELALWPNL